MAVARLKANTSERARPPQARASQCRVARYHLQVATGLRALGKHRLSAVCCLLSVVCRPPYAVYPIGRRWLWRETSYFFCCGSPACCARSQLPIFLFLFLSRLYLATSSGRLKRDTTALKSELAALLLCACQRAFGGFNSAPVIVCSSSSATKQTDMAKTSLSKRHQWPFKPFQLLSGCRRNF